MKKMKLKTLSIILMLFMTPMIMFPIVQESNALPKELKDINDGTKGHRLIAYNLETMTITTSEASHVLHGWTGFTKQELKDLEPFEVKVYLDGIEIELDNCKEKVGSGQNKTYNVWFYQTFETNYFTPGIYNWTVVWSDVTGIVWYRSHPLTVLNEPHRLVAYNPDSMTITASERSFVKHGWAGLTDEDIQNLEPLNVHVYLDGVEIELYSIIEEIAENTYNVLFYNYFDAYYFTPGIYNWTVVWSDVTGIVWYQSHPLTVLNDPHRISMWFANSMTITTSERSFICHGWSGSPEQIEDVSFYENVPYDFQIYIDDQEIDLYQKLEIFYNEFEEPVDYAWFFYQHFDSGYFAPGEYDLIGRWSYAGAVQLERTGTLYVLEDGHRLNVFQVDTMTILDSEISYVRHGWRATPEQFGDEDFYNSRPFEVQVELNGQPIELYDDFEIEYDEFGEIVYYYIWFYQVFDEYYFTPDTYDLTIKWIEGDVGYFEKTETLTVETDS